LKIICASLTLFAFAFIGVIGAQATAFADGELRDLYRGVRATAMGGAFVAIADDEEAIFFNPAGTAGFKNYNFNFFTISAEASNDIVTQVETGLSNLNTADYSSFLGKNVDLREQITSTLTGPHFGIAYIQEGELAYRGQNLSLPQVELGYQFTSGIQVATGFSVLKNSPNDDLRVGIAGKSLWRQGGYNTLTLDQLLNVNQNTIGQLAGNYEQAFGMDLGTQYIHTFNKRLSFSAGAAWTDIGNTTFGGLADPVENNLSVGLGLTYLMAKSKLILAYDYRNITQDTTWQMRNHVGFEYSLPVISIQGGMYETSYTYGASVDLWLVRVSAVSYSEDLGSLGGTDTERRWLAQASFKVGF
jgi:hypothetical protein